MERSLARILDANFNRAREGLRVVEEFARFAADDARLAESVKRMRHELADAARRLDPAGTMIESRDTAGDVGAALHTDSESRRGSPADVATAAAKRVGEALRVLCEYAKLTDPAVAAGLDALRYRFYDWEKWLAGAADRRRIARARVYLLLTADCCRGGDWQAATRAAIDGGVDVIQLREKNLDGGELLNRAGWLAETCRSAGVLSVINDRPDIARLAGADGVHVGRSDLPVSAVRGIIRPTQFVGVSTHAMDQLDEAIAVGPDYVAMGPMFATTTKPDYAVAGPEYAAAALPRLAAAGLPHVAVGGVSLDNVAQLVERGVRCVAVCSAILRTDDVAAATRQFKSRLTGASA